MGFSVADIARAALLIVNALAILSERRLLAPLGLAHPDGSGSSPGFGGSGAAGGAAAAGSPAFFPDDGFGAGAAARGGGHHQVRDQVRDLLSSVRLLLRWPLIALNSVAIVFALIFG